MRNILLVNMIFFALGVMAQSELFVYDGGYVARDGSKFVNCYIAPSWGPENIIKVNDYYLQDEDRNYYYVASDTGMLAVPKKSGKQVKAKGNSKGDGSWMKVSKLKAYYSYFPIKSAGNPLYCYGDGYFIENGESWVECRPADRADVWAYYTIDHKDSNFAYLKNMHAKVCVPLEGKGKFYIHRDGEWRPLYKEVTVVR